MIDIMQRNRDRQRHGRRGQRRGRPPAGPLVAAPARIEAPAATQLTPGRVVRARIPYEDAADYKVRPAVVLARRGSELVVLPVTSSRSRHRQSGGCLELSDLEVAGLGRECAIVLRSKRVPTSDVIGFLGRLSVADRRRLAPELRYV